MRQIFYKKVGRRYKPVYEYDQELMDALPEGYHLLSVYPGGRSTRFKIDPNYATLIAASRVAEDSICQAIHKASEMRPRQTPITEQQKKIWKKLADAFGDDLATLNINSSREIAEAGIQAMIVEADKLYSNPSVRKAYERFVLVCELTKE